MTNMTQLALLASGTISLAILAIFCPGSNGLRCFQCEWFSEGDDDRCLNAKINGEDSLLTEAGLDHECGEKEDVCKVLHSGNKYSRVLLTSCEGVHCSFRCNFQV